MRKFMWIGIPTLALIVVGSLLGIGVFSMLSSRGSVTADQQTRSAACDGSLSYVDDPLTSTLGSLSDGKRRTLTRLIEGAGNDTVAAQTIVAVALAATGLQIYANDGTSTSTGTFPGSDTARALTEGERATTRTSLDFTHDKTGGDLDAMGPLLLRPSLGFGEPRTLMDPTAAARVLSSKLRATDGWSDNTTPWTAATQLMSLPPALASTVQAKYPTAVGLVGTFTATPDRPTGNTGGGTSSAAATPAPAPAAGFDPAAVRIPALPGTHEFALVALTEQQMRNAAIITAVAKQMGLTPRAAKIALATSWQESKFDPNAVNDPWVGLFQQNPDLYTQFPRTDPAGAAFMFFDQLVKRTPGYDTDPRENYLIGEDVQESGVPENVQPWQDLGNQLTDYLWPLVGTGDPIGVPGAPTAGAGTSCDTIPGSGGSGVWDAGNIVSDEVFYNASAMTVDQVRTFIATQNADCPAVNLMCSARLTTSWEAWDGQSYCQPVAAQSNVDAAAAIVAFSVACGINPQVMLVTWEKESRGVTRTDPSSGSMAAAFGYACPDSGPGGSAACDPSRGGFLPQVRGMAWQWAKYRVEIPAGKYNYGVGTYDILWNVAETGCGSSPVDIKNIATASLYVYTPYQPNAASLAAYPGTGDNCSAYGNRNFFYMFTKWFGSTGGGAPGGTAGGSVLANGVNVTIPDHPNVEASLRGKVITAPNAQVAAGLAWGLSQLGTPYVWGGGGLGSSNPGGPDNGCSRGGGDYNSCGSTIGFDCSGFSWSVYFHMDPTMRLSVGNSGAMAAGGTKTPVAQSLPGDLITYGGSRVHHVAVSLGTIDGRVAIVEAPGVGIPVRVKFNTAGDTRPAASRYWSLS